MEIILKKTNLVFAIDWTEKADVIKTNYAIVKGTNGGSNSEHSVSLLSGKEHIRFKMINDNSAVRRFYVINNLGQHLTSTTEFFPNRTYDIKVSDVKSEFLSKSSFGIYVPAAYADNDGNVTTLIDIY